MVTLRFIKRPALIEMPARACRRQTAKKYKSRPSPPFSAQACRGTRKQGNDGHTYVSRPDSRGVYRWTAAVAAPKGKVYETHDNGGRPFAVEDLGGRVVVHRQTYDAITDGYVRDRQVFAVPYKHIWIGKDAGRHAGNSILLQSAANRYVFIGDRIYEFALEDGDSLTSYHSPVGNSDVPYPYAIGKSHTYLLLDGGGSIGPVRIPNEALDFSADIYGQFYGHIKTDVDVAQAAKPIRGRKMIAKRLT
jgi:hypothetical protein